jgi:hypothetical protein
VAIERRERLPFQLTQTLLALHYFQAFVIAKFGLRGAMSQGGELPVNELIAQTQNDVGQLLHRVWNRAVFSGRFRDHPPQFRRFTLGQ